MLNAESYLEQLASKCIECGVDLQAFVTEKVAELEERKIILATPSLNWYRLNAPKCAERISRAIGRELSDDEKFNDVGLLARINRRLLPETRQSDFDVALKSLLLQESNDRCKICGITLTVFDMVIDHIIPIAEGGSNHTSNLRATCELCNSGKSDYYEDTVIGAARPWWEPRLNITSGSVHLSAKKRYCALVRDRSTCRICGTTAKDTKLEIEMRLNKADGGQPVYDNLLTVCDQCISK